jgi:hypothetical protein
MAMAIVMAMAIATATAINFTIPELKKIFSLPTTTIESATE